MGPEHGAEGQEDHGICLQTAGTVKWPQPHTHAYQTIPEFGGMARRGTEQDLCYNRAFGRGGEEVLMKF